MPPPPSPSHRSPYWSHAHMLNCAALRCGASPAEIRHALRPVFGDGGTVDGKMSHVPEVQAAALQLLCSAASVLGDGADGEVLTDDGEGESSGKKCRPGSSQSGASAGSWIKVGGQGDGKNRCVSGTDSLASGQCDGGADVAALRCSVAAALRQLRSAGPLQAVGALRELARHGARDDACQ